VHPRLYFNSSVGDGTFDECDIYTRLEQHIDDSSCICAGDAQSDARMSHLESAEHGRQQVSSDRRAGGHAEHAAFETSQLA
jgi:hypothetical protein